jgi:hypothetical protein
VLLVLAMAVRIASPRTRPTHRGPGGGRAIRRANRRLPPSGPPGRSARRARLWRRSTGARSCPSRATLTSAIQPRTDGNVKRRREPSTAHGGFSSAGFIANHCHPWLLARRGSLRALRPWDSRGAGPKIDIPGDRLSRCRRGGPPWLVKCPRTRSGVLRRGSASPVRREPGILARAGWLGIRGESISLRSIRGGRPRDPRHGSSIRRPGRHFGR